MSDKELRQMIDRLDSIEADLRAVETKITRIRLDLLHKLNLK